MNDYPPDWPEIARHTKDAAGWRCARCGHKNCVESGHVLTVHHFDGDKGNCEPWNLMPLCQRCHLSVQARVDPGQGLMFTPSDWALPYIAGMVAAGKTPEPPGYDLGEWIALYERHWPTWAPK